MDWWRKSRFGMFIHWGLYAVPAGEWNGNTGYAEWIREEAHIPVKQYEGFVKQFNPVKFDAKKWAKMAHDAGMQYLVITSKHHDGFNMFDSRYTDFKVTNTPWHRDPIKELSKAVRGEGMKFCLYHSIMDWHHPDYLPRRSWETKDRPATGADFSRFVKYLRNDVHQIITDYKPSVLWFDGEWENTWKEPLGTELYALCRVTDPKLIINNRVGHARDQQLGDYSTPEQTIPATGLPGVDWETCMTMNGHWGYNKADHDYKSVKVLIHDLVDIASKGGNFLLNIGPKADGTFPPEAIDHLKGIGAWMHVNSDSIYNTSASLFDYLPWGRCTVRAGSKKSHLFLHVFDWPKSGTLVLPGLGNTVLGARILGGPKVAAERTGANVTVHLPAVAHSDIDTVVEVDVAGSPVAFKSPTIETQSPGFISSVDVSIQVPNGLTVRYTTDGSPVTSQSKVYTKPIRVDRPLSISAAGFYNGKIVSQTVSKKFEQLTPWPASSDATGAPGIDVEEFQGDFDHVADFLNLTPSRLLSATKIGLDPAWKVAPEHIGRVYSAKLIVPTSELYRFVLTSDDGASLWIDGKLVVNNDGAHSASDVAGFAPLEKGPHSLKVAWFNKTGDAALNLRWAVGAGGLKPMPAGALLH